ncbi:unnamed protein product [Trifolium pratense]|uniref:Uncharacterized protein n=1 Tax=Trifolium pratense TaxID=57577 RepID=A0ACB0KRM5_TRIPR|nr:unnamed protein product [Trifolium pratense]
MSSDLSSATSVLRCTDELVVKFLCPICAEIYFEPCTTSCGHSFCKDCLQSSMAMSGTDLNCPICGGSISNGLSYRVNVALWNAVQFLFPQRVKSRKVTDALNRSKDLSAQPYKTSSRSWPPLNGVFYYINLLNDGLDIISRVMLGLFVIALPYMTYVVFEKDFR